MKVKDLIKKLEEFDKEKQVGGCGHFGEILEIYDVRNRYDYVEIVIEDAGQEPD